MSAMSTVFKGLAMSAAPEVDAMTLRGAQSTRQDAVSVAQLQSLVPNEEGSIFMRVNNVVLKKPEPQVIITEEIRVKNVVLKKPEPQVIITRKAEEDEKLIIFGFEFPVDDVPPISIEVYCLASAHLSLLSLSNQQNEWMQKGKVECDEPSLQEFRKFLDNTSRKHVFTVGEPETPVWTCLEHLKPGAKFSKEGKGEGLVRLTTADEQVVIIDMTKGTLNFKQED